MIGILSLQGDVAEHRNHVLARYPRVKSVKRPGDLKGLRAIILPGGESTTITKLLTSSGLDTPLKDMIRGGLPVWGTCAGAILLCENGIFSAVEAQVERNSYGPQLASCIKKGTLKGFLEPVPMVFIRAPRITGVGSGVETLSIVDGDIVALRQKTIFITTYHPELMNDQTSLSLFLDIISGSSPSRMS